MRAVSLVTIVVATVLVGQMASAQTMRGSPVSGRTFAVERCAECHVVVPTQTRVVASQAPPFDAIAKDPKTTALSLRVFFRTPHVAMPNFILSEAETDDVIAYILSLSDGDDQ